MIATMTSKGQVTLPKAVRELLNLKAGDRLDFHISPDGIVTLRPALRSVMDLVGILARPGQKAISVEEMDEGIAEAIRERAARSKA